MKATYTHPITGQYNETVATLEDGRKIVVNTQYEHLGPLGSATLDGIDTAALISDARINGKFGYAPRSVKIDQPAIAQPAWKSTLDKYSRCPKCGTYCGGNCPSQPVPAPTKTTKPCPICHTYCCGDCKA